MRTYFKVLWGIFSRVLHLAPWVTFFPYYYWRKTIWQTASSWPQTSTTPCNRIHRLFLLARRTQGQNRKHVLLLQTSWHKQKRICFFTPHKMDFPLRTNRQNQGTKKKRKQLLYSVLYVPSAALFVSLISPSKDFCLVTKVIW